MFQTLWPLGPHYTTTLHPHSTEHKELTDQKWVLIFSQQKYFLILIEGRQHPLLFIRIDPIITGVHRKMEYRGILIPKRRLRFIKFSVPKNQELRLVLCPDVSLSKIYDLLQIIILNMFPPPLLAPVISYIFLYYNITIKHIWLELTFTILLRHSENKEIIKVSFLQLPSK